MKLNDQGKKGVREFIERNKRVVALASTIAIVGAGVKVADQSTNDEPFKLGSDGVSETAIEQTVENYKKTNEDIIKFANNFLQEQMEVQAAEVDSNSVVGTETNSPVETTEQITNVEVQEEQAIDIDNMTAQEKDDFMKTLMGKDELTKAENEFVIKYIETLGERSIRKLGDDIYYNYLKRRVGPLTREENEFISEYLNKMTQNAQEESMKGVPTEGGYSHPEGGSDKEIYDAQKEATNNNQSDSVNTNEQEQIINTEAQQSYDDVEQGVSTFPKEGPVDTTGTSQMTEELQKSEEAGQQLINELNGGPTEVPELNQEDISYSTGAKTI